MKDRIEACNQLKVHHQSARAEAYYLDKGA